MLVSAVLDPSTFDARHFDELYTIHVVNFLKGFEKNGLLIVDSENRLRDTLVERYKALPSKPKGRLRILVENLLLKKRSRRIIACFIKPKSTSLGNLLDFAYQLKTDTKTDVLIVGADSMQTLMSEKKHVGDIVPLFDYLYSDFEKCRQRYVDGMESIDTLPRPEVDEIVKRLVRFTKWLRFYDPYIGKGDNTKEFREGIEYILSLWKEHGFFASLEGAGSVEIYTSSGRNVNIQHQKIVKEIVKPLEKQFPWPIRFSIKINRNRIFHARYLETQQAIVRVDRGFDLFEKNGQFRPNLFTLNMKEREHVGRYQKLSDAAVNSVS